MLGGAEQKISRAKNKNYKRGRRLSEDDSARDRPHSPLLPLFEIS
jgi:hypothetical protein